MLAQTDRKGESTGRWMGLLRQVMIGVLGAALLVTIAGGFLHTKAGRPLMARIFGGGCPLNHVTAEQLDAARHRALGVTRGTEPAPARPAFRFELDRTSAADVNAWALQAGVACHQDKAWLIKCSNVEATALGRAPSEGRIEELALGFAATGRLVNVTTLRRHLSPDQGSQIVREIATSVASELGASQIQAAAAVHGNVSAEPLSSMALSLKYSDYIAEVSAMNLPASGVLVREHYLSARD